MRRRILIGIAALFYYSGLVALARWWTRRTSACVIILNYHRAGGGDLRRHLLYLRRHYRILPIETALEFLYAQPRQRAANDERSTALVLTFDDGYQDNYTHALMLARELQMPMAIYLVPGYIEASRYFWWEEGRRLVDATQVCEVVIEAHKYALEQAAEREALAHMIDHHVRYASSVAEREQFLHAVSTALDVPLVAEGQASSLSLSWMQIEEMDKSGYITFGGHTVNHPILAYLDDAKEVQFEVTDCRTTLEQRLGHVVRSFAYPVGQQRHISDTVVQAVRIAGYDWAMTTSYGFNTPQTDRYRLKRIEVDVDQHWLVMAAETAGLWGLLSRLRWLPIVRKYFTNSR